MLKQSIIAQKEICEAFSVKIIRSPTIQSLIGNNRPYRHLFRFAVNVVMFLLVFQAENFLWTNSRPLSILIYPLYLFIQSLIFSGFIIHAHEFSHNHIKWAWLNNMLGVLNAGFTFVNFFSFQRGHILHHGNIGNIDAPEAGAPVSPKGQLKIRHGDRTRKLGKALAEKNPLFWLFLAWPIFVFDGDYNSWILPLNKHDRSYRSSVGAFGVVLVAHLACLVIMPISYLILFLAPMLIGGSRFIAITYLHHSYDGATYFDENHHNFYNVIMANTDRNFGPIVNFFMMNNGFHIPHHLNPQIAYYDLKRASDYLRSIFPKDLSYPYFPKSRLYRDLKRGKYEQRISENHEFYRLSIPIRASE